MGKITLFILAILLFVSCAPMKPTVGLQLTEVNGEAVNGMVYIDDNITVEWAYSTRSKLNFKLMNNTKSTIKILWDIAAFVNVGGSVDRVMHAGVKYADRNEAQPPSPIPSGAFIEDVIIPTTVVAYNPYSGWTEGNMFEVSQDPKVAKEQLANTYGKIAKVVLPIDLGGHIKEYQFSFLIRPITK